MLRGRWCHRIVLNIHAPTEDKTDDVKDSSYEEIECVPDTFPKSNPDLWICRQELLPLDHRGGPGFHTVLGSS
jgi:hypothetical protein